ncbi:hypothetical protein PLEOSDRAFT_1081272 [Pleurotus ostreatus PC15]|uniref:DUF6533 domain-containing protein n=1 Tax=Pleurotus ostreatus (strain PC15) TaxID=1137138 RepID=A0A067NUY0_PLEO1|nr:hypothetical protein PLEOSDRAFT_1081272 [Pleurotus ostreatus PC15]
MSSLSIMDRIVTGHRQYYTTQYVHLSSFTVLLWDYIITLPDEVGPGQFIRVHNTDTIKVELFWAGNWSYPRVLFFVNRYQAIGWQVVHTMGQVWVHNLVTLSCLSLIIPVHSILGFRVYGLYNREKWIAWFLAILLLGSTAAELYVCVMLSPELLRTALPFSNIVVCEAIRGSVSHLYMGLIPAVAFDTSALILVLVRGITYIRTQRIAGYRRSTLLHVLMRDSILYFLM